MMLLAGARRLSPLLLASISVAIAGELPPDWDDCHEERCDLRIIRHVERKGCKSTVRYVPDCDLGHQTSPTISDSSGAPAPQFGTAQDRHDPCRAARFSASEPWALEYEYTVPRCGPALKLCGPLAMADLPLALETAFQSRSNWGTKPPLISNTSGAPVLQFGTLFRTQIWDTNLPIISNTSGVPVFEQ
eukprot:SAG31_NODE_6320_length_2067_cov_1.267785_1_plen_189_part_00